MKKGDIVKSKTKANTFGLAVDECEFWLEDDAARVTKNFRVLVEGEITDWEHPLFTDWELL